MIEFHFPALVVLIGNSFHCLFCHGFEERGAPSVGVLAVGATGSLQLAEHLARLAHNLADAVTIYTNGDETLTEQIRPAIERDPWLSVDPRPIRRLQKTDGVPVIVELQDGATKEEGFLVHGTKVAPSLDFEHNLDLELSAQGTEFKTTPPFNECTTRGVFAAGDCGNVLKAASVSIGHGAITAAGVVTQLVFDEKA